VHLSPRSVRVAASRGVCDRPRRGPGRRPQPGTAASARPVVGHAAGSDPAPGLVPGGRSSVRRRTFVSPAELRRRGADRFRPSADTAAHRLTSCSGEHQFDLGPTDRPTRLMRAVLWYQRAVDGRPSPCRFTPTCSSYALEALHTHGTGRGLWLTVRRLVRCRPFGPSGWDPVPEPTAPTSAPRSTRSETGSMRKRRRA
jgi:uncharacterized protein